MFNIRFVAAVIGVVGEEEEVFMHGCLVSVLQALPVCSTCAIIILVEDLCILNGINCV